MGCGASKLDPETQQAREQSDKIEKQLRQDKKVDQKTVKILLLGKSVFPHPSAIPHV